MDKRDRELTLKKFIAKDMRLLFLLVIFSFHNANAQGFSANAGIGLEYFNSPSLSQYLNYASPGSTTPGAYMSAVQFVVGGEYPITSNWSLGLEYGYITKSVSNNSSPGSQQIDFSYSLPSLTLRKLIAGEGYYLKFGGGIGYHFATLTRSDPFSGQSLEYSAHGLGLKIDALLDTKLGDRLYARVNAEARAEFTGDLKSSNGSQLTYIDYNTTESRPVDMYLSGVGIAFGLVYYF